VRAPRSPSGLNRANLLDVFVFVEGEARASWAVPERSWLPSASETLAICSYGTASRGGPVSGPIRSWLFRRFSHGVPFRRTMS